MWNVVVMAGTGVLGGGGAYGGRIDWHTRARVNAAARRPLLSNVGTAKVGLLCTYI